MGLREQIAEEVRRAATGDTWYTSQLPYVLEMRSPGVPPVVFVFPVGPKGYSVRTVYRQSVTPTVGGLVSEERGILWREITIQGTFGLEPKVGYDTSSEPDAGPSPTMALSGPMWTRRMLRGVFNRYAELKADPERGNATVLVWHDVRTDDHWIVVPEDVEIARTVNERLQYPFTVRMKAIGDGGNPLADVSKFVAEATKASPLDRARAVVYAVNQGVTIASAALQEGSAILGEVRFFASQLDSVLDSCTTVVRSATDFVDGVTATISIGRTAIQSAVEGLEEVLALLETSADLPDEVRQNYWGVVEGLEAIAAQVEAFGETYAEAAAPIKASERGAARESRSVLDDAADAGPPTTALGMATRTTRAGDVSVVDAGAAGAGRAFGTWTGFRDHTVTAGDSLPAIAAAFLGDGGRWYELALINGLSSPYISPAGGPGVARPGDVIAVPVVGGATTAVVPDPDDPGNDPLGTDIAMVMSEVAIGRPAVDMAIDERTLADFKTITGPGNLVQALQLRMWTEQGRMPLLPTYGFPAVVGYGNTAANVSAIKVAARSVILSDSRVARINRMSFAITDDVVEVDADVVPIGSDTARTVTAALT